MCAHSAGSLSAALPNSIPGFMRANASRGRMDWPSRSSTAFMRSRTPASMICGPMVRPPYSAVLETTSHIRASPPSKKRSTISFSMNTNLKIMAVLQQVNFTERSNTISNALSKMNYIINLKAKSELLSLDV